jgi:hypothetical protein
MATCIRGRAFGDPKRWGAIGLACLAVLVGGPVGVPAEESEPDVRQGGSGDLTGLFDGQHLLLVDGRSRMVLFYRIADAKLKLLGGALIDEDLEQVRERLQQKAGQPEAAAAPRSAGSTVPDEDVPGEDPPGFDRPGGWVRIGSSSKEDRIQATYIVRQSIPEVFPAVRDAVEAAGLSITEWNVDLDSGGVAGHSDDLELSARLHPWWKDRRFTQVSVSAGPRE